MGSPISANVVVRTLSSRQIRTRGRSSGHSAVGPSNGSPSVASCKKRLNTTGAYPSCASCSSNRYDGGCFWSPSSVGLTTPASGFPVISRILCFIRSIYKPEGMKCVESCLDKTDWSWQSLSQPYDVCNP